MCVYKKKSILSVYCGCLIHKKWQSIQMKRTDSLIGANVIDILFHNN